MITKYITSLFKNKFDIRRLKTLYLGCDSKVKFREISNVKFSARNLCRQRRKEGENNGNNFHANVMWLYIKR